MIKSLSVKDIATFNNDGITLNDLKQINIIYGSNGSGKSTIGKVIADINSYGFSSISWQNDKPLEILAYNKNFCKNNFEEQMPGIFTLGEASTTAISEIETKRTELNKMESTEQGYLSDIEKKEACIVSENKAFCESAWSDIFKKYEQCFPKSAIGAGTKEKFIEKLLIAYKQDWSKPLLIDKLKEKANVLFAQQPSKMDLYAPIDNSTLRHLETDTIWLKIIVGTKNIDIAGLITKLGNSDWVNKGMEYIENDSDVCPFCQQHTITSSFRSKLNDFFDETYKQDISKINTMCEKYENEIESLSHSVKSIVESLKKQERLVAYYDKIESIFSTLVATLSNNRELMFSKQKEPSRTITLVETTNIIDELNTELTQINAIVTAHNNLIDNFAQEKTELINEIWTFFASEYHAAIAKHNQTIKDTQSAIKNLNTKKEYASQNIHTIKNEITKLENSITSITPAVNEINRLLMGYGFTNFRIQEMKERKNHYQIIRENGEPAKTTLSEGETTFITFLYYMQLVKGSFTSNGITADRVLVIDDPISSLDSNVLFVVSTLLRNIFTEIHEGKGAVKQVILLTHNVYFHKEVSFVDRHCKWRGNVKYWVLRKRNNTSSIQDYGNNSPIKSSYELMWTELKNQSQYSCIVVQNIMRRIIENYFLVLGGISPSEILAKFENSEERIICKSLLSWVNDGSHSLPDDIFVEMPEDQLERNMKVFQEIFHKMGQEAHYEMMMQRDSIKNEYPNKL